MAPDLEELRVLQLRWMSKQIISVGGYKWSETNKLKCYGSRVEEVLTFSTRVRRGLLRKQLLILHWLSLKR